MRRFWIAGLGIGLVGVLGLAIALRVPSSNLLHFGLIPLDAVGFALSLIAYLRSRRTRQLGRRWVPVGGLALAALECVVGIAGYAVLAAPAPTPAQRSTSAQDTTSYYAGGNARGATVEFSSSLSMLNDDPGSQLEVTLPWHQDVQGDDPSDTGDFAVIAGPSGGTVTCVVIVDGKVVTTASATGGGAIANCDSELTPSGHQ
jgi:hypothetical protein